MHQSTTPSFSQTIWPRWVSRQFLSLPIVQTLLPMTFGYSLSSEAVVMRQLRRWKRRDEGHWHTHTRGLPWGIPEVAGTVQQVHCNRRRLLRRGLEFHVCTINKSAHTKKVWKHIECTLYVGVSRSAIASELGHQNTTCEFGGARGVMVIVVGNGHGDTSSNPGRDWLHFT